MESLSWSAAIAIVGSVLGLCMTALKIVAMTRTKDEPKEDSGEFHERIDHLFEKTTLLESKLESIEKDIIRQETHINKVNDLIVKLLTGGDD